MRRTSCGLHNTFVTEQTNNRRQFSMEIMKAILVAIVLLVFWPPSFASAGNKGHIMVDCAWVAGYLHGVAVLRDHGANEATQIERAETLASAERWPDGLKLHLRKRIHLMFADFQGDSPYSLSADYLYNCTVAGGDIPENGVDESVAAEGGRVAQTLQ
jgi:hypothetical protein